MRFSDPDTIKIAERRLIDFLIDHLNWKAIKEAVKLRFNVDVVKEISVEGGDIIIFENEIAFRIHLGLQTGVSLTINRRGELLDISFSKTIEEIRQKLEKPDTEIAEEAAAFEEARVLSSEISEMILKINTVEYPGGQKDEG